MDFGDILDRWEKKRPMRKDINALSACEPVAETRKEKSERRSILLRKRPDASIDLHNLDSENAWIALQSFFEESKQKGLEKLLIIHGKGNHSKQNTANQSALRDLSRRFIESCPIAGESGYSNAKDGGTGATWVILK